MTCDGYGVTTSTYTIKSGDTLSKIAKEHGTTVAQLARLNNINNVDVIFAGRTLKIQEDVSQMSTSDAIKMLNEQQNNNSGPQPIGENGNSQFDNIQVNADAEAQETDESQLGVAPNDVADTTIVKTNDANGDVVEDTFQNVNGQLILQSRTMRSTDAPGTYATYYYAEDGKTRTRAEFFDKKKYTCINNAKDIYYYTQDGATVTSEEHTWEMDGVTHKSIEQDGLDIQFSTLADGTKPARVIYDGSAALGKVLEDFRGLENYSLVQHAAKVGVGAITVNGEQMLISTDGSRYQLHRLNTEYHGTIDLINNNNWINTDYSSKDELIRALNDKNNDFGTYSGFKDINDVFIP